ncbi:hypothetical protein KY330_05695 [Candidatus Woesearchaeota archaeon]|nr:hypothetical protein [Candidatus Woesearchaeota archaeon]
MLQYILVSILIFASVFLGHLLAIIAKEEIKHGVKYFKMLQKILFLAIVITTVYFYFEEKLILILSLILLAVFFYLRKRPYYDILSYVLFSFFYFVSYEKTLIIPSLMFIYGLPTGSLLFHRFKKNNLIIEQIFIRYLWFILLSLVLYLLFS